MEFHLETKKCEY